MQQRTWPYGTKKQVTVSEVIQRDKYLAIISIEDGTKEGFVCLYNADGVKGVEKGQKGTLTFRQGGPTGGYWDYASQTDQPD